MSAACEGNCQDQRVHRSCSWGRSSPWPEQWCQGPAVFNSFGCSPWVAGPSPKGDSHTHLCGREELKGMMEHLPALWLPEIPRKSLPPHTVFNKGNSSVLIAAEMYIWVESLEMRHSPFFMMNPYSQGVKSCWADTCKILTLMGI